MYLPKQFNFLKENEIAGADTINPIIQWLRGIRSASDFIEINPNGNNSMSIDLDLISLRRALDIKDTDTILNHTFKATETSSGFSITGGTVFFGIDKAFAVSGRNGDGEGNYYIQCTSSGGSIQKGTVGNVLNPNNQTVNLPLLQATYNNNEWNFKYYHVGNFAFLEYPDFWISGYDKTKPQFLAHNANSDGLVWIDATDCEE
jgi:hypothetical protein